MRIKIVLVCIVFWGVGIFVGCLNVPLPPCAACDSDAGNGCGPGRMCVQGHCQDNSYICIDNNANKNSPVNTAEFLALLQKYIKIDKEKNRVTITGANLEINNGQVNGLGNLIVGPPDKSSVTGSHNVIVGSNHTCSGSGGMIVGLGHKATANYATIVGGQDHTVSGDYGTIVGGEASTAGSKGTSHATVVGGQKNSALGKLSTIVGGGGPVTTTDSNALSANTIEEKVERATICGGSGHQIQYDDKSPSDKPQNSITVVGGQMHKAYGTISTIVGGESNTTHDQQTTIIGGMGNTCGTKGTQNTNKSGQATVVGGKNNQTSGKLSTIVGGGGDTSNEGNNIEETGIQGTICGGSNQKIDTYKGRMCGGS